MPHKDPAARKAYAKSYRRGYTNQQKQDLRRRKKESIARARDFIIDYLRSHPCTDCNESDVVVLDFDHLPGSLKTGGGIARMVANGVGLQRLADEIAKCEVVCANCHRRRTASRAGWFKLGAMGEG